MTTGRHNKAPFISVLMSCYNASRWLDESIQSILNQSYEDFEFIIVDDGSEDDTLAIARYYAASDDRVILISKPNTGLADSLNFGIKQARGEWIARLDADDLSEHKRLEKQVQATRENPALVFIGTGLVIIDEKGQSLSTHHYPSKHEKLVKNLQTAGKFPAHSSAFYRYNAVQAIGGYRPRIHRAQDWDLWLRLSEVGQLTCLFEPLVRVRKHESQISYIDSGRQQIIDSRTAMVSYWIRQLNREDPVSADEKKFLEFYAWVISHLESEGLFAKRKFSDRFKFLISDDISSPVKLLKVIFFLIKNYFYLFSLVKQLILGETLTRKMAANWLRMR